MTIRKIEEADIPALAEFERDIAVISFGDSAMVDLQFHQKKIRKAMQRERDGMLVLEKDGEILGWLWMTDQINSVSNEHYINFKSFSMKPHSGDEDCTGELMEAGMAFARSVGAKRVVGKVFVENLPMRAVYRRFGFRPTHLTMEYTADGELL